MHACTADGTLSTARIRAWVKSIYIEKKYHGELFSKNGEVYSTQRSLDAEVQSFYLCNLMQDTCNLCSGKRLEYSPAGKMM